MMEEKRKASFLSTILRFILLFLCTGLSCERGNPANTIAPDELINNGYKYIIFGSQDTDGIELYDLKNKTFQSFLKRNGQRFTYPIVHNTGTVYFLRESGDGFEPDETALMVFDFKNRRLKHDKGFPGGHNITLSPDNKRIAFIDSDSTSKPCLKIYDIENRTVEKNIPIKNFYSNIVWKPDNNTVVLWGTNEIKPAYEVNIFNGKTKRLILFYYPLEYFQDKFVLLFRKEDFGTYLKDLEKDKLYKLEFKGSLHSEKFSKDGKYLVAALSRGWPSIDTLTIIDTNNPDRTLQVKVDDPTSNTLGIDLW